MKLTSTRLLLGALIISSPLIASAQTVTNVPSLFTYALQILNGYVVPIIFAIAFVMFILGVFRYFIQNGGNAEKVQEGQKFVLWSIIGFVIMFSIWGIINLFINTLGFGTAAQPAFPTFNGSTNSSVGSSIGSIFNSLLGGSSSNGVGSSAFTPGSTFTDANGTSWTYTAPNTVAQQNGNCPPNYSPSGSSSCINNATTGSGTVGSGGSCTSDGQCTGDLACVSGKCQADPSLESAGYGQGNGTVTAGGTCKSNDDCAGNLACSDNDVCVTDGDLEGPGYGDGDGTVQQGGACMDGADCAGNLTCTNGICAVDSQLDAGNGTVGAACTSNTQCGQDSSGNELECINSQCEEDNGQAQQGESCTQDSDCQGNLSCQSGSCQPDSSLESQDNYDSTGGSASSGGGGGD